MADKAGMGIVTVRNFENDKTKPVKGTLVLLQQTLEAAGIEFIDENGGGPGVRLNRKRPAAGN